MDSFIQEKLNEFDEKCKTNDFAMEDEDDNDFSFYWDEEKIKSFLRTSLQQYRDKVREEIERMKTKEPKYESNEYDNGLEDMKKNILSIPILNK